VSPRCLVCDSPASSALYELPGFSVLTCQSCGQVYLNPLPSEANIRALFSRLYTTGEGSLPELRSYYGFGFHDDPQNPLVQLYERWLAILERHHPPGRLLDIGCGTGLFLVVARRRGWTATGIDDCDEAARHAVERFGCDVRTGNFEAMELSERFDAVTMWDILEHARRPLDLLASVRRTLAPGGIVALATPNDRNLLGLLAGALYRVSARRLTAPLRRFYIEQHFLYFTPRTITQLLSRAGLAVVELGLESTDLRRLTLSSPVRFGLEALFSVARWTALENRLFAIARPTDPSGPFARSGRGPDHTSPPR
jgi:SAM-dependent methyltransferase